ncbi:Putative nucleic acid-binding protein [Salinibacterium sp. NYA9b]
MQRPGKEGGYRYALPAFDERFVGTRQGIPPDSLVRMAMEHAKRLPVSRHTDRFIVPRSRLRAESLELGHSALAIAHEVGLDRLFRTFAMRGLPGKTLRRVLPKWNFLRSEIEGVIPLDDDIAAQAVVLANLFVHEGHRVKGTSRNTMNDMLVAATSQISAMPLLSADVQLMGFYEKHGWSVTERGSVFVATPKPRNPATNEDAKPRSESRGYVNRPLWLRSNTS